MRVVTSPGRSSQHAQHVTRDLDALAVDLQLPMAANSPWLRDVSCVLVSCVVGAARVIVCEAILWWAQSNVNLAIRQ
jgi:hypothetical protein